MRIYFPVSVLARFHTIYTTQITLIFTFNDLLVTAFVSHAVFITNFCIVFGFEDEMQDWIVLNSDLSLSFYLGSSNDKDTINKKCYSM